ncbi:LamG-like jellyroll fold domain-containing protein [Paenibacillus contaminans]|uniref:Uncharacterized protein n=1 Tax=Paenibacillus contaminans TaxID=450362 RepID=A0A329MGM8_9BACL|nr:LamG-like jellyroll fold domain-containing protein [Paenibacillus contaminans]RAV18842.1 hypothetical protein DQG23_24235 [Paenibacillus contaminans]
MQYNKTNWVDHIIDGLGNVIQQGTPVSAGNLNKLERGLKDASVQLSSELAAQAAHSGVLDFIATFIAGVLPVTATHGKGAVGTPIPSQYLTYQNQLGISDFSTLINGAKVDVSGLNPATTGGNNRVFFPAPPVSGERDDLVYLEAWRDLTTQDWKVRIRTVAGIDFSSYTKDGFMGTQGNVNVQPQGGNAAPLTLPFVWSTSDSYWKYGVFKAFDYRGTGGVADPAPKDPGLYIAGDGTDGAKGVLKSYDGYVYAIPLFKVRRRNSGGYSTNNPNGAIDYFENVSITTLAAIASTTQSYIDVSALNGLKAGDKVSVPGSSRVNVIKVISGLRLFLDQPYYTSDVAAGSVVALRGNASDRPDGLYSNIIDERDITDLRHKTYLVAPPYQQLLTDGLDQHLRGVTQPERRKAMRTTYVGVRKTPIDSNHIFYASFDSNRSPEIGSTTSNTLPTAPLFKPAATGSGVYFNNTGGHVVTQNIDAFPISVEAFVIPEDHSAIGGDAAYLFALTNAPSTDMIAIWLKKPNDIRLRVIDNGVPRESSSYNFQPGRSHHVRLTITTDKVRMYINGNMIGELSHTLTAARVNNNLYLGFTAGGWGVKATISDFAVSKIDRGATFATLPSDFIAGYADITPALNYQRRINSDVLTPQKSYAVAKVQNQTQERGVTVTKGTGVNTAAWEAGDKIKVRGWAGEIIGGVIDSDTALGKILRNDGTTDTLYVGDTSKFSVNDTIQLVRESDFTISSTRTITAVNSANGTITVNTAINTSVVYLLFETTASTSSPVVRAIIAGTSTTVPGTWANLGTNEAEFTLGTLPGGLDVEEIIIEYSLNMAAGQGGLFQVYSNILGGEANGKKLVKGTQAVTDDFAGKIIGSTTVNPNKAYSATNGTTATPGAPGTEFTQADYDAIKTLDASLKTVTTSVNGQAAAIVVSKDIIRMFEDKGGKLPGVYTVAEKVAWLKVNIGKMNAFATVCGTGPAGNMARTSVWNANTNSWTAVNSTTNGVPTRIGMATTTVLSNFIDANGFAHFLCYADPSDGVTTSAIFLDYVNIELEVVSKAGYDILVPENPRRDAGLSGLLYVRRQTREVESLFSGNDEDNGIIVIGDYVPTQEFTGVFTGGVNGAKDVLLGMQGFVTVAGTNKAYAYDASNQYANAITRLLGPGDDLNYKVDPQSLVSTVAYDSVNSSGVIRYWNADIPHTGQGLAVGAYSDGIPLWASKVAEFLSGMPSLVEYNGELLLRVSLRKRSAASATGLGAGAYYYFRLPGRPLIKL